MNIENRKAHSSRLPDIDLANLCERLLIPSLRKIA